MKKWLLALHHITALNMAIRKKQQSAKAIKEMAISSPEFRRKSEVITVCPRCVIDDTFSKYRGFLSVFTFIILLFSLNFEIRTRGPNFI